MEPAVRRRTRAVSIRALTAVFVAFASTLSLALASSARASQNVAKAWGFNEDGELGDGTTQSSGMPVEVSGLRGVVAVAGGAHHSLALLKNGTVMAWGENFYGQLGNGTKANSLVPVRVNGLSEVAAVAAGENDSLALRKTGTVMAWGKNSSGQLGDGITESSEVPLAVSKLTEVAAISAGGSFSLALLRDGTVMAWGENFYGQLGNGTKEDSHIPAVVSRLTGVTAISAGFRHALALLSNGTVVAWGDNEYGQLGNATESDSDVPTPVSNLSHVSAISAGRQQSLAVVAKGAVMAWGDNELGQLGDGTNTGPERCGVPSLFACGKIPVAVSGLSEATAISAGGHSLALLANGTLLAWGPNNAGQLGVGSSTGPEVCSPSASPCSTVPVLPSTRGVVAGISAGAEFSLSFGPPVPPGPLPELGRCVKVASGGAYSGTSPHCTALSSTHTGHFEWLPGPGSEAKFKDDLSEPRLETVGAGKLNCVVGSREGEYTTAKTATVNHLTLEGCRDAATNTSCQSNPLEQGHIEGSVPLEAELGFITSGEKPSVGWDLKPRPPATSLVSFECGSGFNTAALSLEGAVIGGAMPIDQMVSAFELLYKQSAGQQIPEFFEGGARAVLSLTTTPFIGARTSEQAGLNSRGVRTGAEPLEIKAKA
jgi:alpha-tubulin suppressor-like RCC1 family protein